ncbi:MAG: DNA polymerase II large subunit [DPANN group archaeon]|nr:DNA polymerase II large subunit [DPANN group archaeon]
MTKQTQSTPASPEMEAYFQGMDIEVNKLYALAGKARAQGFDPEDKVSIFLAENMAQRVEGLLSIAYPQLKGTGLNRRIEELEKKYGALAWEVALVIAEEVAKEKFCSFTDRKEALEAGIRAGFAYHTVGIVSAPLEGFIELRIKRRKDGKEYLALSFAGPIRGAGGTGASVCVLIGDYLRGIMGFAAYDPGEDEINRFIIELDDYHERITNLQYHPSPEELGFLVSHLAVEIDGEPSERIEVSNYKDLPRVETNKIRSGVCLVLSMLALKAPKLRKRLKKWGADFHLDWDFLHDFLIIQKKAKAGSGTTQGNSESPRLSPNYTYIADLVAGRPVLSNPMEPGGFRLRYGRTRATGFSAAAIHPGTAHLFYDYIATGTQLKVERPGKAAAITFCDAIEGPIVKLFDGSVVKITSEDQARRLAMKVKEILFLGDILFSYGDFSENGHLLIPAGYNQEWFVKDFEKGIVDLFGSLDLEKAAAHLRIPFAHLLRLQKRPLVTRLSLFAAVRFASALNIPLHPDFLFHWNAISLKSLATLLDAFAADASAGEPGGVLSYDPLHHRYVMKTSGDVKRILELMGVPHGVDENLASLLLGRDTLHSLLIALGLVELADLEMSGSEEEILRRVGPLAERRLRVLDAIIKDKEKKDTKTFSLVEQWSTIRLKDKSGTFIGARMGRPEKAKQRKMTGSPHTLFPVGEEGGRLRSFQAAMASGKVTADFPWYVSETGEEELFKHNAETGKRNEQRFITDDGRLLPKKEAEKYGNCASFSRRAININQLFRKTLKQLGMSVYPDLIKGVRGTANKDHIPEHLAKGILRAKNNIFVNKDGTTRYDMSEVPLTHFKPREIGTSIERLKGIGYTHDVDGKTLVSDDQVIELKPQDLVLPGGKSTDESADQVLFKVGGFIDDLLVKLYGLPPYYRFRTKKDLVGTLVIGLAPHISAGLIGRIIGFSKTQGCFAHPLWHAGLRRDCDGDEACVMLLLDGFLNFSAQYLPDKRGAKTMDAPLVLTKRLVPSEVDDMVHGMDVAASYPLELYHAAEQLKYPWDVDVDQLGKHLAEPRQYEGMHFTHPVSSLNMGVTCSAYKTLPSMEDKLRGQMKLATRIRAVEAKGVATLVIEKHFLKDIKGNLRKFSQQQFRCVNCNQKYRRPPLKGICLSCGGRIIFTVSEGSVVKYLEPSISLAEKYGVSPYLKQTLELTRRRIEDNFGRDQEKQTGLGKWFG